MAPTKSIWFHLGHALERARQRPQPRRGALAGLVERSRSAREDEGRAPEGTRPAVPSSDELMAAGVALLVDRALGSLGARRAPGFTALLRAAAAGAAAALIVDLVRPLIEGEPGLPILDRDTADRMLAGVGHGLVYGAIVEPRIPGPPLLKGALYGSVEFAADPLGGLSGLLGSHTPHGKLPVLGPVIDGLDAHDRAYLEHVVFGMALALIYESNPSSNGIRPEEE